MDDVRTLPFPVPPDTSLAGVVGMIVCWWWDDDDMLDTAVHGVSLVEDLLAGATEHFTADEWWIFQDAIGSYLNPDADQPALAELYEIAKQGHEGTLPPGPTKRFAYDDDEDDGA